jgi:hypothetical protein
MAMGRQNRRRPVHRGRHQSDRAFAMGSHWRADGAPKASFRSQSEALSVADDRRRDSGLSLSVYLCDFCHCWHMGKSGGRER